MKIIKVFSKLIAVVVAILVFAVIFWYSSTFLPYMDELGVISERGNLSMGDNKKYFYRAVVAAESKDRIRSYAMRQAYWSLVYSNESKGNLKWHFNNALWYYASFVHLNDQEVFGILVDCGLFFCGKGLNKASSTYYGKKIVQLSNRELIGMAALVKSPSRYKPGSRFSENRIKKIIEKLEDL